MKFVFSQVMMDVTRRGGFYGYLLAVLDKCEDQSQSIRLCAINGRGCIYYDPSWIRELDLAQQEACGVLQAVHYAARHLQRAIQFVRAGSGNDRSVRRQAAMVASVLAAGELLREDPAQTQRYDALRRLPGLITVDMVESVVRVNTPNFTLPRNATFEAYAEFLLPLGSMDSLLNSLVKFDETSDDADPTTPRAMLPQIPESVEDVNNAMQLLDEYARRVLADAQTHAQRDGSYGSLPGDVREQLDTLLRPKSMAWWERLRQTLVASEVGGFEWDPLRLSLPRSVLHARNSEISPFGALAESGSFWVQFVIDSSGSVTPHMLRQMLGVVDELLARNQVARVDVLCADVGVQDDRTYTPGMVIAPEVSGRGGTDVNSWFEYLHQKSVKEAAWPALVVICTDTEFGHVLPEYRLPPTVPLLWLVTCPVDDDLRHRLATTAGSGVVIFME